MRFNQSLWDDSEPEYAPLSGKRHGRWYWAPSTKYKKAGYAIKSCRLVDPHGDTISLEQAAQCRELTREMLKWYESETNGKEPGTWAWMIGRYLSDDFSSIKDVGATTREGYRKVLATIEDGIGNVLISETDIIRMTEWKRHMEANGRSVHYIKKWFTHFGLILSHGKKIGCADCMRIKAIREEMRIKSPASRSVFLNREQAYAIIAEADRRDAPHIALSVLFRFEYMLRGVDVYGEWEPAEGRKGGIQHNGRIWTKGLTWEMFTPDLKSFTKQISKTRDSLPEPYTWDVVSEIRQRLAQTPAECRVGPVITLPHGRPPMNGQVSKGFKRIVRALKLPDELRLADGRAGGITEAKSMVDPYMLRDAAQHTQITTTDRYVRNRSDAANKVVQMRGKK